MCDRESLHMAESLVCLSYIGRCHLAWETGYCVTHHRLLGAGYTVKIA